MFWRRPRPENDFAREIDAHLEHEIDRLVHEGVSLDEATAQAKRTFGNALRARERFHDAGRFVLLEQVAQDLRYGWRGLWQSRPFVATTVLTLAVGMSLVTVVFAVFSAYVLRPFAVRDPYSLHLAGWRGQEASGSTFRWRDYQDLAARTDLFDAAVAEARRTVTSRERQLSVGFVSGNYFEALGARVALGRGLFGADALTPGSQPVAVLTDSTWARLFDRDPLVIGREIEFNGHPFVIVGVMSPEFSGMDEVPRGAWVPMTMYSTLLGGEDPFAPGERRVQITVRLRHDVSVQQARAGIALEPFETRVKGRLDPVGAELVPRPTPVRMTRGQLVILSPVFAAFALVLIAACANTSNIMLARANARHREIGIRLSIGASRGRVVRQLLTEGLLIAALAALLGLALAAVLRRLGADFVVGLLPPSIAARVRFVPFDFDGRVFLFVMLVACAVTVLCALLPALHATRLSLTDSLRGQLTAGLRGNALRKLLVTGQVTVSLVLVIVAATLVRNGSALQSANLGMDTTGAVSVRGDGARLRRVHPELSADPRVSEVGVASRTPLFGAAPPAPIRRESRIVMASHSFVSPEYFGALRIPILRGRSFSEQEAAAEAPVAIVSAGGARMLWPGEEPIGKTLRVRIDPPGPRVVAGTIESRRTVQEIEAAATEVTIIGLAQDVVNGFVYQGLDAAHVYLPTSLASRRVSTLVVRGRSALTGGTVQSILARVSPDPLAFEVLAFDEIVALQMFPLRLASWIGSLLSAVALALSISGLYGVLAYTFAQRVKEIGVRIALGATTASVRHLVFRQAARLSSVGAALGVVFAYAIFRLLAAVVHLDNVSLLDPVAFIAGVFAIGVAVALASYGPARRASRVDPVTMLRTDA